MSSNLTRTPLASSIVVSDTGTTSSSDVAAATNNVAKTVRDQLTGICFKVIQKYPRPFKSEMDSRDEYCRC